MDITPKNIKVEAKPYRLLTYSNISMFLDCPMKYYFRNIVKIVPIEKSKALAMGAIFHDSIDLYFKNAVRPIDSEALAKALAHSNSQCLENRNYLESNEDVILHGMIQGFVHQFAASDLKIYKTEQLFDTEFDKESHRCGKVDAFLVNKEKQKFLGEWKTATQIDTYVKMIQTSNQANHYFWGFEDEKAIGVVFCIAKKSQLRLKKDETIEKFRARILDDYLNRPLENFHREIVFIDAIKLERWKHEVFQISGMIDFFVKNNCWYRNTGNCWNYNTLCPYHKICETTSRKHFDEVKAAHYLDREPGEELFEIK